MNRFGMKPKPCDKWYIQPVANPTPRQVGSKALGLFIAAVANLPVTMAGTIKTVVCPKCGGSLSANPGFRAKHLGVCPNRAEWHAEAAAKLRAGVLASDVFQPATK